MNGSWSSLWRRHALVVLAVLIGWAACGPGAAQTFESVLSPGKVIQGHAKYEDDCRKCHVPFDRSGQDGLCMDCHKEVGADVRQKLGFHGRIKQQTCRSCHTDHRGRDVRIADFDQKKFDHVLSDYELRGAHLKVECAKCHVANKRWREAPSDCVSCHKKDDSHKGALGTKCEDCHGEVKWKETRFDHGKTRFALAGKHADAKCDACHKNSQGEYKYKDLTRTCIACHKADDNKSHKGQYGEKCESCHTDRDWKKTIFNHDLDTKFALRGKHRSAKCDSCHKGHLYKEKLATACLDCHKKDDKHNGTLGKECGTCHTERDWKEPAKFDHDKTKFPLRDAHADPKVKCTACHKDQKSFRNTPTDCYACHKKDDKHEGTLGEKCADCHGERDWKVSRFDHDKKTKFALRGAHGAPKVKCADCHKDPKSYRKTPTECYACHKKDDKHEGQLDRACDKCHTDRDWKVPNYDHSRTRFPLTGRHIKAVCKDCHETPRYKDAKTECYSCHKKDDKHKLRFGLKCESCHNTRDWTIWDFDHDRRSEFKLEGAHRKLGCETCHQRPAPTGKPIAAVARTCVGCHRIDDVHDGSFGAQCERCHTSVNWKQVRAPSRKTSMLHPSISLPLSALGDAGRMAINDVPVGARARPNDRTQGWLQ